MLDAMATNIWVRGAVMNEMLAASGCGKKAPAKFAYDHSVRLEVGVDSACTTSNIIRSIRSNRMAKSGLLTVTIFTMFK